MIGLAWLRVFAADKPAAPALFVDRRCTSRVLIPGPPTHPCAGPNCGIDTGSEAVTWCSHNCLAAWHHQQLNTPTTAGAPA